MRTTPASTLSYLAQAHMQKAGVPTETYAGLPAETVHALYPEILDAELTKVTIYEDLSIYDTPHVTKLLTDFSLLFHISDKRKHNWSKMRVIRESLELPIKTLNSKKTLPYIKQVTDLIWNVHNRTITADDSNRITALETDIIFALKPFENYTTFQDDAIQMTFSRNSYSYLKSLLFVLSSDELQTEPITEYVNNIYAYTVEVCNTISQMASR